MYEITSGVVSSAQKVVIYGPEGIGKSTFAAQFPDPVFIDTEGSTKKLNIRRFPKPTSWEMLKNEVKEAMNGRLCKNSFALKRSARHIRRKALKISATVTATSTRKRR